MHRTATMCRVLGVSASGYWAWQKRPMSEREKSDRAIEAQIREIHHWSQGTYGVPRMHAELAARRQQPFVGTAFFIALADDARTPRVRPVIEQRADLVFDDRALFLDDQDFFQSEGERVQPSRDRERPHLRAALQIPPRELAVLGRGQQNPTVFREGEARRPGHIPDRDAEVVDHASPRT